MGLLHPSVHVSDTDLTQLASELSEDKAFWIGESKIMLTTDYPLTLILDGNKSGHSVKEIRHSIVFASLELKLDLDACRVHVSQGSRSASKRIDVWMASHIRQYYADNYGTLDKDRLGRKVSCRFEFIEDNRNLIMEAH